MTFGEHITDVWLLSSAVWFSLRMALNPKMQSGKNADSHFVAEAASGGMEEVELGKLASQKATKMK